MASIPASSGRAIPAELSNFDKLPNSAHVREPVVAGLYGCSPATVWRGVKAGRIPAPKKLSENISAWNVGDLRKALGLVQS
jgi:predicted DNA-binding transcriptional regulator AlpA